MCSRFEKRGFTLIELLVVIAIIAILASILFPVFAKAREKARQTTCLSQVRQLATAVQMYSQDNNSKYPNYKWAEGLSSYIGGANEMFWCPSDVAQKGTETSYGYSGLLLDPLGNGVAEAVIKAPTEVGILCDAEPAKAIGDPGIVGGGVQKNAAENSVNPKARHSKGLVVGYADGHAKYINQGFEAKDMNNPVTRAFFMAPALGFIENYGGGFAGFTAAGDNLTYILGGDSACAPLMLGAAAAYKSVTNAPYFSRGFTGLNDKVGQSGNYMWGNASGSPTANSALLGYDAMVLIVAKNTKLARISADAAGSDWAYGGNKVSGVHAVCSTNVAYLFGATTGTVANTFQAYTFKRNSGSRDFFVKMYDGLADANGDGKDEIGPQALEVNDDIDMVDKVSNDPYGIGYCSSSAADPDRVEILALAPDAVTTDTTTSVIFPQKNPKYRWFVPDAIAVDPATVTGAWPMWRALYADLWAAPVGNTMPAVMFGGTGMAAYQASPYFSASYFNQ